MSTTGKSPSDLHRLALPSGIALLWNEALEQTSLASTVLVADQGEEHRRQIAEILAVDNYRVLEISEVASAIPAILEKQTVQLIILDNSTPGAHECCRQLKLDRQTELTPVLLTAPSDSVDEQLAALSAGADDVLLRPFHPDLLRIRVRNMLRQKTVLNQLEQTESILFALAQAVEKRDQGTSRHCERIAIFSVALGMSLALPRTHLLALYRGGYLHDIGKVAVPDAILFKQGSLSAADWEVMRGHTLKGEEICGSLKTLSPVLPIIRSHHERWDGSGYPDGLRGPAIPLLARILQMADIYDALTCARPYKAALSPEHALSVMQQETERGWRDPDMMELFRRMNHRAVAEAAEQNATAWQDVDSIRSSLTNLARHIGEGRWIATV